MRILFLVMTTVIAIAFSAQAQEESEFGRGIMAEMKNERGQDVRERISQEKQGYTLGDDGDDTGYEFGSERYRERDEFERGRNERSKARAKQSEYEREKRKDYTDHRREAEKERDEYEREMRKEQAESEREARKERRTLEREERNRFENSGGQARGLERAGEASGFGKDRARTRAD
ncbi:MAG: hypothetical protein R6V18_07615 [Desulfuromonadaceae bacterium]